MVAGTDEGQGSDFAGRLGILAQILSSVGTGRAMPDIAGSLASLDDRSAKRRAQTKADRMVARAASKIAERDPELAAAMMADTAFGMQMLGKQYERRGEREDALALQRDKFKLDLENDLAVKKAERDANMAAWLQMFPGLSGGGAAAPVEATPPAPGISDVGSIPAPTGLTAGTGTEPAPTNLPIPGDIGTTGQPISAQPDLQQAVTPESQPPAPQQQAPIGSLDPLEAVKTMLSGDEREAAEQIKWTKMLRAPVPASALAQLKSLVGQDPSKAAPIFAAITSNWEEQKRFIQGQQNIDRRALQQVEDTKAAEARALQEKLALPGMREKQYREGLTEVTGQRGPIITTQLDPASRDVMTTLKSQGFGLDDQRAMADPEAEAAGIIAGVRTAEGPGAAVGQTTTRLDKRREDLGKAADAEAVKTGIQGSVTAMQATIPDKPEFAQMKAELAAIPFAKDPVKALDDWRAENRQTTQSNAQMRVADADLAIKAQTAKEATKKIEQETAKATEAADYAERQVLDRAFNATKQIKRVMSLVQDPGNLEVVHGKGGWIEGLNPGSGSTRRRIEAYANSIESILATDFIQGMKKQSANGATGLGNTNQEEIQLAKTLVADLRAALENGTDTEYALKRLHNYFNNMIMPDGGERFDEDSPGFQLESFNMEKHNPALFVQQQRKNTVKDGDITIRPNQ
jgi:hypothetical protein